MKPPKTLGACVDVLYRMREERLAVEKTVDALKNEETAMRDYIINTFSKSDIEGAKGKVASCSVIRKTVAQVEDWDKLYNYIEKNKAWDLLQRRVSDTAFRERLEAEETVPGVNPFVVVSLSLTKAGK